MSLIKSISGIRGTIGGLPGENLTPLDVVKFTAAYGTLLKEKQPRPSVVVGRDGRISGPLVHSLVVQTLIALGIDVIDLGVSTTPTVEFAVVEEKATGGIILTASHNPRQWNALKLLNEQGEFLSAEAGKKVLEIGEKSEMSFASVDELGTVRSDETYLQKHIAAILNYPLVDAPAIAAAHFSVVVDAINSSGVIYVPALLNALGVQQVTVLNEALTGDFAHNPEPLPEHLTELSKAVVDQQAHLGIAVDPDVDRLCFVNEDGSLFGEEYTLVAVADHILSNRPGNTVSNMSSTAALKVLTRQYGGDYHAAAVGEVNVVSKMKAVQAVIGGEGNGGVIVPDFHYGRDALIGIGLFLTLLAKRKLSMTALRATYPEFHISKNKIDLQPGLDLAALFSKIQAKYVGQPMLTEDGLRIEFGDDWVHLRGSNTEPIIRIYAESTTPDAARDLAQRLMADIQGLV
jgi:phosphomannomutase